MNVTVLRDFESYSIEEALVLPTDYAKAVDGSVHIATNFPRFRQRFLPVSPIDEILRLGVTLVFGYVALRMVGEVVDAIFSSHNDKPLTKADRAFIRERDEEICYYCSIWAPNGHVDHIQSRKNFGPNAYWNLTWACIFCNLSKGALNWDEFLALD